MKIIRKEDVIKDENSKKCKTMKYSFGENNLDIRILNISGRYPDKDYCVNTSGKELMYVLEGDLELIFENKNVIIQKYDSILIDKNEKYYCISKRCKVLSRCVPA